MKYRRCKVATVGSTKSDDRHYAWIPVDRAFVGQVVAIQFQAWPESNVTVTECDTLVIDGSVMPFCGDEPAPRAFDEGLDGRIV